MKHIHKTSSPYFIIQKKREFYDTECPIPENVIEQIENSMKDFDEVQAYLEKVYYLLRQGADPKHVEVPECLKRAEQSLVDAVAELSQEGQDEQPVPQGFEATSSEE